ncbi:MAG TPA: GIY-YIG nuclease family protein [Terriglobia bacterium]|nr:GIY-YIG nuclease family protein [Terriglobia bacterium]
MKEAGVDARGKPIAHDENFLLQSYCAAVGVLAAFRQRASSGLERRQNPNFPGGSSWRRFGSKRQLVDRAIEYCAAHPQLSDVLAILRERASEPSRTASEPASETAEVLGFVYLIKSGRFFKIGRSNAASRREYELAIQLPEKVTTVHTIRTDDPVGIERYWHQRFETKRKGGEWFDLSAVDVAAFRRRKFM